MRILSIILFSIFLLCACGNGDQTDSSTVRIFTNGTIYTGTDDNPVVEAVAVDGNRIVFTGTEADARTTYQGGEIVDLGGAFMYPGFVDAHEHILGTGQRELILNLEGSASIKEVQERLAAYAKTVPEGEPMVPTATGAGT